MAIPPEPDRSTAASVYASTKDSTAPVGSTRPVRRVERVDGTERGERVIRDAAAESRLRVAKATEMIWLLVGILEGLLALRVILKVIAANPGNSFASFIYRFTDFFLAPFFGITGSPAADGVVLEVPTIIAMIVYALFAWALVRLTWVIFDPTTSRSATSYERDDR